MKTIIISFLFGVVAILVIAGTPVGYDTTGIPGNVVASSTNITFTLIQTNFVSGQLYTNSYGAPILVSANATLTTAAVSGDASLSLQIAGTITNVVGKSTLVTSLAENITNSISALVPLNSTYTFTNTSAGSGDSATVSGGQILVY